ncbi:zincin-like metallopeptidase domain-containing protein, partial [uncultured Brevundimonas sp.]|uniref:zincin-like metallopeptidase domain-containing protein n=1 Tax=uncultured Brevundimonas sp. TaxID=213418 RepID=UPI00261B925B
KQWHIKGHRRTRNFATLPKSATVVKIGRFENMNEETGEKEERGFARAYRVFNADQIDGLPEQFAGKAPEAPRDLGTEPDPQLETFFAATGAHIATTSDPRAYYNPVEDVIHMPPIATFHSASAYSATLAHETVHYAVSWVMPHGRGLVAFAPVFGHATVRHNQSASRNSEVLIKCRRSRSLAIRYAELSGRSRQQETVPSVAFPAADRVLILNGH